MKRELQRVYGKVRKRALRARTHLRHAVPNHGLCPHDNVFHASTQKTASQWIRRIMRNVYDLSGLDEIGYEVYPDRISDTRINQPFPRYTFVSQLYLMYAAYDAMPKPASYKTVYVVRDPRDILVSWYYSIKFSHEPRGNVLKPRETLQSLSEQDGMHFALDWLINYDLFAAQKSWLTQCDDPNVKIMRYEDLAGEEDTFLQEFFTHIDVTVPSARRQQLIADHGFEALAGRKQGKEDVKQHYRKGVSGDWEERFDDSLRAAFKEKTGDLLVALGYETDDNW